MSEMFLKKSTQLHTQNYCFGDCKFNQMQPKADRVNLLTVVGVPGRAVQDCIICFSSYVQFSKYHAPLTVS